MRPWLLVRFCWSPAIFATLRILCDGGAGYVVHGIAQTNASARDVVPEIDDTVALTEACRLRVRRPHPTLWCCPNPNLQTTPRFANRARRDSRRAAPRVCDRDSKASGETDSEPDNRKDRTKHHASRGSRRDAEAPDGRGTSGGQVRADRYVPACSILGAG